MAKGISAPPRRYGVPALRDSDRAGDLHELLLALIRPLGGAAEPPAERQRAAKQGVAVAQAKKARAFGVLQAEAGLEDDGLTTADDGLGARLEQLEIRKLTLELGEQLAEKD